MYSVEIHFKLLLLCTFFGQALSADTSIDYLLTLNFDLVKPFRSMKFCKHVLFIFRFSLNKLLDDFRVLDNSNLTNALLDDIKYLADGILAFTSLRDKIFENSKSVLYVAWFFHTKISNGPLILNYLSRPVHYST